MGELFVHNVVPCGLYLLLRSPLEEVTASVILASRQRNWLNCPMHLVLPWLRLFLFGALLLGNQHLIQAEPAKVFRAGAATVDISPWMGLSIEGNMHDHKATNIHDPLHARAIVLDDGQTRLAIVVADSCMIPRPVFD